MGKKRIIVLVDFFTWSFNVVTEDRFTEEMGLVLPSDIEAIIMGCTRYGTAQEFPFLETEGMKDDSELIIVHVHWGSDKSNNTASEYYGYQNPISPTGRRESRPV